MLPHNTPRSEVRPQRFERRARLVSAIARGRQWLDDVVSGRVTTVAELCAREKCSVRQVNLTISLAFLAPNLVKAAIEGRLPAASASSGSAICRRNRAGSSRHSDSIRNVLSARAARRQWQRDRRLTLILRPAKLQLRQPVVTRERERHGGSVLYSFVPKHEGHKP